MSVRDTTRRRTVFACNALGPSQYTQCALERAEKERHTRAAGTSTDGEASAPSLTALRDFFGSVLRGSGTSI